MNRSIIPFRGMTAVLWLLFSGCAVLTVDVDVYKGALVNEEHVQLHQLVALATAAKPMLIQLRDNLEWPDTDGKIIVTDRSPKPEGCSKEGSGTDCGSGQGTPAAQKPEGCSNGDNVKEWYQAKYVPSPAETTDVDGYIPELESKPFWRSLIKWFAEAFITGPPPTCQPHFNSPYARRVNDVLSLYEDMNSPEFALSGKKLREALERSRRTQGIVEFNEPRDRQIFAEIEQGLKQDLLAGAKGPELTKDLPALQALLRAYRNFLVPIEGEKGKSKREVGQLMDALKKLVFPDSESRKKGAATPLPGTDPELGQVPASQSQKERLATQQPEKSMDLALIQKWKESKSYEGADNFYDRRMPFRAVWKLLGEQHIQLDEATRRLCLDDSKGDEACHQLNKRIKELVDAYWESRQAARDLWEESLSLLVRIERVKQEERKDSGRYDVLKDKVIRLAVKMTSVRQVASALSRLRVAGTCQVLENVLTRTWTQTCEGESKKTETKATRESEGSGTTASGLSTGSVWTEKDVTNEPERYESMLERALSNASAETVLFLLALASAERDTHPMNSVAQPLVEKANRVNDQRPVLLGLNRNFVEANGIEADNIGQAVEEVNRNLAHGFGRGRLLDGLHTLTENYLDSHNRAKSCVAFESQQQRCAESDDQRRLLDGLVEFAQKLLFLANHDSLASPPGTEGLIVGGGKNILRGLFGDDAIAGYEKTSVIGQSHAPQAMTKRYVRVLQAVGNSILFSANELRERDRYRDLSKKRVPAEVAAVNEVYSTDPRKGLHDLVQELRREQEIAQKQHDEAADRKKEIEAQLGSATSSKTGLHLEEETARNDLAKAEQDLNAYRAAQDPLKAIHEVLTPQVIAQIKARWTAAGTGPATNAADFMTGSGGMDQQLTVVQQKQGGTPTPDERRMFGEAITYVKSPEARTTFEACCAINGHTALTRAELLDAFATHLHALEAKRATRMAQYEQARGKTAQALADLGNKIAQLKAELARLVDVIAALPNTKARLATAARVIEAVKDEVLNEAAQHDQFTSPDAVYLLLATHVKRKGDAETDATKKQAYQDTQVVLAKRTPPFALPPLKAGDYSNPLEVMDQVIALLRHRQMEAVERFGKDSDEDKKATEALENAYQHRTGMIYLRPSSAYLRTSFPSTSLQDDPNLAWDNMLLSQGIRNLPLSSQLADILNPSEKQDRTLTAELDKQYWQNINRVRVSGAGFTNQALVKDDVGNWYVKQYFGDTKDIVKSAKHLALFALGTKLPIDLSHELRQLSSTRDDSKKTASEKEAELPPLQQVFGKHKAAYQAHTVELSARLAELHGKDGDKALYNQILAGWESRDELKGDSEAMTALKTALGEEVAQWDKNVEPLKKASDQERGLAITKDLKALAKLEKRLSARIEQDVKAESSKIKAASEVRKAVVGRVLFDLLRDHKQGLDRYEQAILFIGAAANPKDPKQEQGK